MTDSGRAAAALKRAAAALLSCILLLGGTGIEVQAAEYSLSERGMPAERRSFCAPSPQEQESEMTTAEKTGIAIIGPSGYVPDEAFERAVCKLEEIGYRVKSYYDPAKRHERFAADDKERLRQIHAAAEDPDVKIVMPVRGGYGLSRLLPDIDFKKLALSGKLFVGYSDFTVFHMGLLKEGAVSFSGPMAGGDFGDPEPSEYTIRRFEECLNSESVTIEWESEGNPDAEAEGVLWGGNLAMLSHLAGTPWMPDIEGGILFLEDIGEQPYRIERMLIQLDEAGILGRQRALVLGHFNGYKTADYDNGYDFDTMLAWIRNRVKIPVVTGLPFGHVKDRVTLPVGAPAHLVSKGGKVRLYIYGYPSLK